MKKKTQIQLFAGIIITVIIIYYTFKAMGGLDIGQVLSHPVNWVLAVLSAVLFAFSNYVRALAYTFGIDRNLKRMTAFRIIGIGHATNMVLPLRAGEGLRLAFFPDDYPALERTRLLVVQGVSDFIVIMVLAVLAVPFAGFKEPLLGYLKLISLVCVGVGAVLLLIIALVPKLKQHFTRYLTMDVLNMFIWVTLSWLVILFSMWIGLIAYGYGPGRSVQLSLSVFSATNIIGFVPASPGSIGLFEYGVVLGMGGLGVSVQQAKMAGLFLHLIQYMGLMPLLVVLYLSDLKNRSAAWRRRHKGEGADDKPVLKKQG